MANVTVRGDLGSAASLATHRDWMAPIHRWRDLLRWDPFAEMLPLGDDERPLYAPNFDVKETKEGFVFKADVPGVNAKDIDVQITDNRLTVSGKREHEKEQSTDTTYRCERSFGAFSRSFTLPSSVDSDKVQADIKDGVLTIAITRRLESQPKQIAVKPR